MQRPLSNFGGDGCDSGELPWYEDEEYVESRTCTPLRKRRIDGIAAGSIASILGTSSLVPMSRTRCSGLGATSRPTDPPKCWVTGLTDSRVQFWPCLSITFGESCSGNAHPLGAHRCRIRPVTSIECSLHIRRILLDRVSRWIPWDRHSMCVYTISLRAFVSLISNLFWRTGLRPSSGGMVPNVHYVGTFLYTRW